MVEAGVRAAERAAAALLAVVQRRAWSEGINPAVMALWSVAIKGS